MKKAEEFVLVYIQKEYTIDIGVDMLAMNYVEAGYIDSMGLIKFIVEIEDEFGIEFSDEELNDPSFKIVGGLIKMIEKKCKRLVM